MAEWAPILLGLFLGGVSVQARQNPINRFYLCVGILLIALFAVFISGEWQQSPVYLAFDLIEAFLGFAAAAMGIRAILSKQHS